MSSQKPVVSYDTIDALDIRTGTITDVQPFPEARNPAYKMSIDFGPLGTKQSSAQITDIYSPDDLRGVQVIAVVNFPPKQIASFLSEVLVLGIYADEGVILLQPEKPTPNGLSIG